MINEELVEHIDHAIAYIRAIATIARSEPHPKNYVETSWDIVRNTADAAQAVLEDLKNEL